MALVADIRLQDLRRELETVEWLGDRLAPVAAPTRPWHRMLVDWFRAWIVPARPA